MCSDVGANMFMFSFGLRDLADILHKVTLLVYKKLQYMISNIYADFSHYLQNSKAI